MFHIRAPGITCHTHLSPVTLTCCLSHSPVTVTCYLSHSPDTVTHILIIEIHNLLSPVESRNVVSSVELTAAVTVVHREVRQRLRTVY